MNLKIHNVKEIVLEKVENHETFYCRDIEIKTEKDENLNITLFSDNLEDLKVKSEL